MIAALAALLLKIIGRLGYSGVVLLMAAESACIPLPSEIIMPFAGYLAFTGAMSVQGAALAGTLGCLIGSLIAYGVGARGGRRWLERHGQLLLIRPADLDAADRWFARHGEATVFFARVLPVIRTFIALPAGVAHMNLLRFSVYTVLGSYLWCLALAWIGARLGQHWASLGPYFHKMDTVILVLAITGLIWYVRRHQR